MCEDTVTEDGVDPGVNRMDVIRCHEREVEKNRAFVDDDYDSYAGIAVHDAQVAVLHLSSQTEKQHDEGHRRDGLDGVGSDRYQILPPPTRNTMLTRLSTSSIE